MSTETNPPSEEESTDGVVQHKVEVAGQWGVLAQVADACDLPRAKLTDAAAKGAVWLQKKIASKAEKNHYRNPLRLRDFEQSIDTGDLVLVNYNPAVLATKPMLPVLVSDEVNYSVWNKPSGMLSQGSRWGDHTTITFQAEAISGKKALLVHRLDRAASGLMLIAHTKNAVVALTELFASRNIEKTYRATVHGGLTLRIKTGRKHQIRSHLSSAGYPVVGDRLFDSKKEHQHDLQLSCVGLKFDCPFTAKAKSFAL